jgi:phosphopantothenoylcysteine synthetase/decarboxylase
MMISSNNDKIIDSLKNDNKIRQEKIVGLKCDLTNLNKKAKFYEKQYNEEVSLINDMSDDDIVLEFAKSFK